MRGSPGILISCLFLLPAGCATPCPRSGCPDAVLRLLLPQAWTATYYDLQPNGAACEPTCHGPRLTAEP